MSIYVMWSLLLAVGLMNSRTRTNLVCFDTGDLFVCGDCVTDPLHPASKGALRDGLGMRGTLIVSSMHDVYFSLSCEQK